MALGRMDNRITLRSCTTTRGDGGSPVRTYTDQKTVWAEVTDIRSEEPIGGEGQRTVKARRFRIRHQTDLTIDPTWQVLWNEKTHEVQSVIDLSSQREVYLQIDATEQEST